MLICKCRPTDASSSRCEWYAVLSSWHLTLSGNLLTPLPSIHEITKFFFMASEGEWSDEITGSNLPERFGVLPVSGFALGFVGPRAAGQTAMGRIVASDVARAITPGRRTLKLLRVCLDLCAVSTRTSGQTANIANGQDQHASWARSVQKTVGEWVFFILRSGLVDILYFTEKRLLQLFTRSTVSPPTV